MIPPLTPAAARQTSTVAPSAVKPGAALGIGRDDIAVAKVEYVGDSGKCACLHRLTTYAATYETFFGKVVEEKGVRIDKGLMVKPAGAAEAARATPAQVREFVRAARAHLATLPAGESPGPYAHGAMNEPATRAWALAYMISMAT